MLLLLFLLLALFSPLVGLIDQVHRRACASPAERNETKTAKAKAKAKAKAPLRMSFLRVCPEPVFAMMGFSQGKPWHRFQNAADLSVRFLSLSLWR